jgi:zinc and cadmium transporter
MTLLLAGLCVVVVAASLLGGALPLAAVLTHTRLQLYLSAAAGVMLGAAFFHMLPEAVDAGSSSTLRWSAAGLLVLFLLERFFAYHHHEAPGSDHDHDGHHAGEAHATRHAATGRVLNWGAAAFGLAVHSLIGGVALASAVAADVASRGRPGPVAWGAFLATVMHKPADALTIVSLMLRAGSSRGRVHLVNLGFALMVPLGVVLFTAGLGSLPAESAGRLRANALAFSAGTFLCIALSDLLPELHFHAHDRLKLSLALLAGFFLMGLTGGLDWLLP